MDEFCGSRFWDSNTFWNVDNPDVTLCFEKTVLIWFPCVFLWLFLPLEICFLRRSKSSDIPLNWFNISKLTAIIILVALALNDIINNVFLVGFFFPVDFYSPLIKLVTFVLFFVLTYANVRFGRRSSALLLFFSLLLVIFGAPQLRTEIRSRLAGDDSLKTTQFVCYLIYYPVTVVIFLLNCFTDSNSRIPSRSEYKNACPRHESSFLSQLFFTWFEPLVWKGYRKPLENEDLWDLDYSISSAHIVPKFEEQWKKLQEKAKKTDDSKIKMEFENDQGNMNGIAYIFNEKKEKYVSIVPALFKTFGISFYCGTLLKILLDLFIFVNPQILSLLIDFVGSNEPMWKGYLYAILLFVVAEIQTLMSSQYQHIMYTMGLQIRACLISIIYKKALCLSNGAERDFTVGEMVNLMSIDANRFVDLLPNSYLLISTPLQVVFSIFFLWRILGPSVLAGFAVLVISILINTYLVSLIKVLQFKQMKKKDDRVKLMNQILSGIKVLKLYAWEPSFEKQVLAVRNEEMKISKRHAYFVSASLFIWSSSSFLVYSTIFAVYVLSNENNVLDAKVAFVSLALFNIIKVSLLFMPYTISNLVQTAVSVTRINKFLNSEDISSSNVTHEDRPEALIIQNGSFSWDGAKGQPILHDINVKINPGFLVAIVGPVGSGKSSLISALLGEMYKISGIVNSKGTIAYVPQVAWIQNSSLRDNITFGEAPSSLYYEKVVKACALEPDLKILPAGDLTEIGEKGINLSGGQKQRVSLARAVYYGADIYLLDDPLSAVDSYVGKHIFEQVIGPNGLLKDKTRVLVTHSVTYLSQVDFIVVMKNGSISESGSFDELLNNEGDFSEFLATYLEENSKSDDEDLDKLKNILVENNITSEKLVRQNSIRSECRSIGSFRSNNGSLRKRKKVDTLVVGEKLTEVEHVETGSLYRDVYMQYIRYAGMIIIFGIALANFSYISLSFLSNMWLSKWVDDTNVTIPKGTQNIHKRYFYLSIFTFLGISTGIAEFALEIAIRIGCWKSAKSLHNSMLYNLFRLPLSFMDVTPYGRIISRFSKDIDVVDNTLPEQICRFCSCFCNVICTLLIIICSIPMFLITIIPISILYYLVQRFYVATTRQLQRLESVSRSPIYSHFIETIVGTQSIRAYGLSEKFTKQSQEKVDLNHKSYYLNVISNRWFTIRSETICNLVIFLSALFVVLDRENLSPGVAGLSIGLTLQITLTLSISIYVLSEVETNTVAIERIKEYSEVPPEAAWQLSNESVHQNWPSKGDIEFQNFSVRYRRGLQLVLKGITFFVNGGQKVGIVGRTGAGKSTLISSLLRILESAEGRIFIDGVDIATLGLHTLRSRLTIIPQDPVLFAGSLRINLDPFDEYSDNDLWRALELAHLNSHICSLGNGLRYEITEGGENFSVGQRQLICLARALLRKTKILILDEATASVDLVADDLIQSVIRSEFRDCTVLTIAHRLNTVMDYDKIIVINEGYMMEYDSPQTLLQSKNSLFYKMAADAGLV